MLTNPAHQHVQITSIWLQSKKKQPETFELIYHLARSKRQTITNLKRLTPLSEALLPQRELLFRLYCCIRKEPGLFSRKSCRDASWCRRMHLLLPHLIVIIVSIVILVITIGWSSRVMLVALRMMHTIDSQTYFAI